MMDKIKEKLKKDGKYWIAFVGDSITSCEWVHPNWREIVEYVLKEELQKQFSDWRIPSWGIRCFNHGYDGATTKDILDKKEIIFNKNIDLFLIMIGSNDKLLGLSLEEHRKYIKEIEKEAGKCRGKVIMMTDNCPWNEVSANKYREAVEIDKKLRLKNFINLFEISKSWPQEKIYTFISGDYPEEGVKAGDLDFWHPNQLGNAYIAKTVLKEVFEIEFDPEKYIKTTLLGEKFPNY